MRKSLKAYITPKQALSQESYASALERHIAELKQTLKYEYDRLSEMQKQSENLDLKIKTLERNQAIFDSNKERVEDDFYNRGKAIRFHEDALKKEWALLNKQKIQAEALFKEAQSRIEVAEQIEKRNRR